MFVLERRFTGSHSGEIGRTPCFSTYVEGGGSVRWSWPCWYYNRVFRRCHRGGQRQRAAAVIPDSTADVVYGQGGSFSSSDQNQNAVSADTLNNPAGVTVDGSGGLYVADTANNRVLHYPEGSTTADVVYGQGGSFSSSDQDQNGVSADSLNGPTGVTIDGSGGLYVADSANNRVLHYAAGSTTADAVYGQGGSFSSSDQNQDGVSAGDLNGPTGVTIDGSGGLYVADSADNRVLHYPGEAPPPTWSTARAAPSAAATRTRTT